LELGIKHLPLWFPIAGFVDRVPMIEDCKTTAIPIRVFTGLLDDVNVDYSIAIYKIEACNADVELTIFDDADMIAGRVYDNQEIYDWMFKQIKIKNEN
jgi:hypothetical protein